jgi:hypothetical protein
MPFEPQTQQSESHKHAIHRASRGTPQRLLTNASYNPHN